MCNRNSTFELIAQFTKTFLQYKKGGRGPLAPPPPKAAPHIDH